MVVTQHGIVATSHALASQAGAQVLARGGSAIDAAIAANAVLGVTEPMMAGIGGDLFVLYREAATGKLVGLNASGPAPLALTPARLQRQGAPAMPKDGIHTVSVPGCVDGWHRLHQRYGKLPWKDLFRAAMHYANEGSPVPEILHLAWTISDPGEVPRVFNSDESRRVFLPGGKVPAVGDVFRNPDLGRALRLIAEQGPDAFYRGEIAKAILRTSDRLGGTLQGQDLAAFSSEWVQPVSTTYRGWTVHELPPNGQGLAALQMLNIMEQFPPSTQGPRSGEEWHKRIEAMKLAYADLRHIADPRHAKVPVPQLLSKEYARERARQLDMAKANCDVANGPPLSGDTTYLVVVDRAGNMASWIQSVAAVWGSGVVVDGMGFPLQSRAAGFTLEANHANVLAPGKRPFHSIIPAMMEKGGLHIGFGVMGGPNQPLAHAQFVSNVADFHMNIQAALEAPRFTKRGAKGCDVMVETRLPLETLQELSRRGHQLDLRQEHSMRMGRGEAILHDARTKVNYGASDPRSDGAAVPEPVP